MEDEIKVGDFVRINDDFRIVCIGIGKVVQVSADAKDIYVDMCTNSLPVSFKKEQIVRHSTNLIDLIECGDYVNGYPVRRIPNFLNKLCNFDLNSMEWIPLEDIDIWETVVTKEQIKAIEYRVKE